MISRDFFASAASVILVLAFIVVYYAPQSVPIINLTGVQYYKENLHNSCHVIVAVPSIVVRVDDVQDFNAGAPVMMQELELRNISMTLGVIPGRIGKEPQFDHYLRLMAQSPLVEVAQHGYNHIPSDINISSDNLSKGYDRLVRLLGVAPVSYVPPYNKVSLEAHKAIVEHFKVLSRTGGGFKSGEVAEVDQDVETYDYEGLYSTHQAVAPVNAVIEACDAAMKQKNLCVVTFHPQELSSNIDNATDVNPANFQRFQLVLDGLERLNATFIRLTDTTRCTS